MGGLFTNYLDNVAQLISVHLNSSEKVKADSVIAVKLSRLKMNKSGNMCLFDTCDSCNLATLYARKGNKERVCLCVCLCNPITGQTRRYWTILYNPGCSPRLYRIVRARCQVSPFQFTLLKPPLRLPVFQPLKHTSFSDPRLCSPNC